MSTVVVNNFREVFWQSFKAPSRAKKLCKEYKQSTYLLAKLNLATKMKWSCLAQFYLYPSNSLTHKYIGRKILYIPGQYFDFGANQRNIPGKNDIVVTSRSAFRVLVSEEEFSRSNWLIWSLAMEHSFGYYPASYLLHIVKEVASRTITNTYLACVVCMRFSTVPEEVEVSELTIPDIKERYRINFFKRNAIPVSFDASKVFDIDSSHRVIVWDRNFGEFLTVPRVLLTKKVFDVVFADYTEILRLTNLLENLLRCWWCSNDSMTYAETESTSEDFKYNTRILFKNNAISYLTCSIPENGGISFKGFLSAFDGRTWIGISSGMFLLLA